ncbi:Uma2 family endonuclease [Larkinella rosea]|uniref:Uma2 family endonuclease n=1 Tax=Larkinella rosea TaxID=2025312 RepID=A0A3P1BTK8_9BACT|nr:Uma2 family endonuclease [Larkinella rosea]RRB04448.1 Uma2 family endonuclease [Larkinella rosea]
MITMPSQWENQSGQPLPTTFQTVEEFEQWQRQSVTEGSFEFVRGRILPKESMKQDEIYIANFLLRNFVQTTYFQKGDLLIPETDSYVDGFRKRIPDLTYFTAEQLQTIRRGERVKTAFAIEILSDSETYEDVNDKIQDYFDGGAQLVWYIAPKRQKIYVYTSPDESKAYKGNDIISAAPVAPDFQFKLADLFS